MFIFLVQENGKEPRVSASACWYLTINQYLDCSWGKKMKINIFAILEKNYEFLLYSCYWHSISLAACFKHCCKIQRNDNITKIYIILVSINQIIFLYTSINFYLLIYLANAHIKDIFSINSIYIQSLYTKLKLSKCEFIFTQP